MGEDKNKRIAEIEQLMQSPSFWDDKDRAQTLVREFNELKKPDSSGSNFDNGDAIITIFSGAGGDDSEDFSAILFGMYRKYISKKGWSINILHQNQNDHGGFRNLTFEVSGKGVYGKCG
jgi:protein subunit release factor A